MRHLLSCTLGISQLLSDGVRRCWSRYRQGSLFGAVRLFLGVAFVVGVSLAGIPNSVGTSFDVGSGWRTSTVSKLDIDANNILGTDGWWMFGGSPTQVPQQPAYVISWSATGSVFAGNNNYAKIDNPATTPGSSPTTEQSGTANPSPGANNPSVILTFTLGGNIPQSIRVGVMIDNLDNTGYNPSMLALVSLTSMVTVSQGTTGAQDSRYVDRSPDWVFFEIDGGLNNEQYQVVAYGSAGGTATVGAVAFDSTSPNVIEYLRGAGQAIAEIHTPPSIFSDVAGQPYANAANLLSLDGISAGCGTSPPTFCPSQVVARGDMAILIVRAVYAAAEGPANANVFTTLGTSPGQCNVNNPHFTDVPSSAYYYCAVQRLYELGITAGCGGTPPNATYCPGSGVTNHDMLIFSWRGGQCAANGAANNGTVQSSCGGSSPAGYPSSPEYFADVLSSDYLYPFAQNAVAVGVISTTLGDCSSGAGYFCEKTGIPRWMAAEWIVRYVLGDFDL